MILQSTFELVRKRTITASANLTPRAKIAHTLTFHEAFACYIFTRIKARNTQRRVTFDGTYICIHGEDIADSLYVRPLWKNVDEPLIQLSDDIREAFRQIASGEKCHIYLAYPKRIYGAKHIVVQNSELERLGAPYSLKLVPYACNLDKLLTIKKGDFYEKNSNFLR